VGCIVLPLRAAAIQMRADGDHPRSLARAVELAARALAAGARLVVLPENYAGIATPAARRAWAFASEDPLATPAVGRLADLSRAHPEALVVGGGTPELAPDGKLFNAAVVLHGGDVVATYRKLHLFDADLRATEHSSAGERGGVAVWRESDGTSPGDGAVLVRTRDCAVGLSICYDLRFAELYRALSIAGAELLVVPAAFTVPTGRAHWEVLVRARAIETQCFVVAAAQHGEHGEGRASFGHSMIVDPWGRILSTVADGDDVLCVDLDPAELVRARAAVPCLQHRVAPERTGVRVVDLVTTAP
jgi:predicted amidohydrolase